MWKENKYTLTKKKERKQKKAKTKITYYVYKGEETFNIVLGSSSPFVNFNSILYCIQHNFVYFDMREMVGIAKYIKENK